MINVYLSALQNNDPAPLFEIPKKLLDKEEKETLNWIKSYFEKYGSLPTVTRLQEDFSHLLGIEALIVNPVGDEFDKFIKERQAQKFANHLVELRAKSILDKEVISAKDIIDLLEYTEKPEKKFTSIHDFDLDWYKRKGKKHLFHVGAYDKVTGGIREGDFTLVAGRPESGKTWFVVYLAVKWFLAGSNVLFISKEMRKTEIIGRCMGLIGKFNPQILRNLDNATKEELEKIENTKTIIRNYENVISVPNIPVNMPSDIKSLLLGFDYDICCIDGLYLMNNGKSKSTWENVKEASNEAKEVSNSTGLPIVATVQLNRDSKKSNDPDLADIAYSDALGQDADFSFAIIPEKENPNKKDFYMVKNRHGKKSTLGIKLYYDFENMDITEIEEGEWD